MQTQSAPIAPSATNTASRDLRLVAVDPARLGDALPLVAALLDGVIERSRGRYSLPAVLALIARGEWVLWVVWDVASRQIKAIVGTEIYHEVSGMRCLTVRFCTGHGAKGWTHLLEEIEAYARREKCERVDMLARKGWAAHLPDYKLSHVFLEREIV